MKKARWGSLSRRWVPPEIKKKIVKEVESMAKKCGVSVVQMLIWLNLHSSKFYSWKRSLSKTPDPESKPIPREHYLLPEEREAVVKFKIENPQLGYRRLTWMMIDQNVAYVSPASVLRILTENGLNTVWTQPGRAKKPNGFVQPTKIHQHWHVDIAYINVMGSFMFLISVLDGYSRYILNHGLYANMEEATVSSVIYEAHEKYPAEQPAVIMDNGGQFIAKEFKVMLREFKMSPRYISVGHPQSNGKIERFHRTIKSEKTRVSAFISPEDAQRQVSNYITFYNEKRLHASLNYLTPKSYFSGEFTYPLR